MNQYGPIITGTDVRKAVEATIRRWFKPYLYEVARQKGWVGPLLPDLRSYVTSTDMDSFVEDQLPQCIIVAPGLNDAPTREGSGIHRAKWMVNVGFVVSGQSRDNTMELAEMYAAAGRTLLLQRKSLLGFAEGVAWRNETYDELDTDDARTLCMGVLQVTVDVRGIVDSSLGPVEPPVDVVPDPGPWPTVGTVSISIDHRSV